MFYNKNRGFTLLEIIIAMFIFSIIAVILTHSLRSTFDVEARTEKNSARLEALQMAILLITRDLEQAVNRPAYDSANVLQASFVGTPSSITFTHGGLDNPNAQLHRSSLQRVHYMLDQENLVRETWEVIDQVSTSKSHRRKILTPVANLSFDYLDNNKHFSTHWPTDSMNKISALPQAVRISIVIPHWGTLRQLYRIPGKTLAPTPAT